jgi:hypothetical protein
MGLLKKFFLGTFVSLATFTAFLTIFLNAFFITTFNENFWLKSFDDANIYTILSNNAEETISTQLANQGANGLKISIPPTWIKQQAQIVLPAVFKYLRGETETINAEISLAELKLQVLDSLLAQLKTSLPISLPDCKAEEKFSVSKEMPIPNCWPTTLKQKQEILTLFNQISGENNLDLPDKISVQELLDKQFEQQKTENPLKQARNVIKLVPIVILGLAIVFVLLLAAIFFLSRSFNIVGGAILTAGIISIIPAILLSNMPTQNILPTQDLGEFSPIVSAVLKNFFSSLQPTILFYSIILIVLGVALIAIDFYLKTKKQKKQETATVQSQEQKQ